ncbi:MAG: MBL fold metallo-hydrolase [Bacteroidia bacterium]|nr:MBL fold metallo-hydrolase [Bacteroidia bacterium]MCF8425738.1 MBL fold metallo-hydrolase [Bacteroidia bacterium]MCF8446390.1 MBL fold metallo-hydrolase [Bacteroidia bacterium]
MLQLQTFVFNDFQENTYLIWDETKECAILDPGCSNHQERKTLQDFIQKADLTPKLLLNTHCHIDHILGNSFVSETYNLPLHLHEGELFTYKDTDRWAAMFNLPKFEIPEKLVFINQNDILSFGNLKFEILFTPGHSIASISFLEKNNETLFSGDVLFKESIGRTDLPGGNFQILENSVKKVLYQLAPSTKIYSGHGPSTTIAHEMKFNPYFTA